MIDYSLGHYPFWSRVFAPSSRRLVGIAGVTENMRVLDVAAGDGNTALAAADNGAWVTALDKSSAQLGRGRERTQAAGATVLWVKGDEERLPFADGLFDCALCTFGLEGVLEVAVDEMFRVVKLGGVVGITDWTGEGFVGAFAALQLRFTSPRPQRKDADLWADEDEVRGLLESYASAVDVRREVTQASSESIDRFVHEMWDSDPELRAMDRMLSPDQRSGFLSQLHRLVDDWNEAEEGGLVLKLPYALAVARKRGSTSR